MKTLALIALLIQMPAQAVVYKYVDANGLVHYTNIRPERNNYRVLNLDCLHYGTRCPGGKPIDWNRVPLITDKYRSLTRSIARKLGVDEALVRAVIHAESAYQPKAVSRAGAQGLMQLMPATQQRFGVKNPFSPASNIEAGVRYLKLLLQMFKGDVDLAVAAYHAGENAVRRHGNRLPPYDSTREYVRRVRILRQRYQRALGTG